MVKRLLLAALAGREEQKAWGMWLSLYPHMVIPQPGANRPPLKFQPFSQFYRAQKAPDAKKELTADQIVVKFEEIKKRHQERHKHLKTR